MMKKITGLLFLLFFTVLAYSQSISGIVNTYSAVTSIPVCNPCASTCNYLDVASTTGFAVGDKVLIIQMKGATIDLSNTASFGTIQSVANAGLYEYKTIASITGATLTFTSTLYNTYDVAGLVQVVRVPQYVNATVTAKLTAQPWNGATGGILVFDVSGTLTLNADVDVTGLGFRGGIGASNGTTYPNDEKNYFYTGTIYELGAPKGEGVAGMIPGYELGKGAYANAGGGGNAHNGGGGGGSNAGAGGLGGNQYNTFTGSVSNGIGGYAISYGGGDRMYMGGGGGAGHQNDHFGTDGGNGGGLIFINAGTIVGNSHKIIASGDSSKSTTGSGNDGAGGAGGGGAIKINATSFSGSVSLIAEGGQGGDNTFTATDEHAPGAGGGGGIICLASATIPAGVTTSVAGGAAGLYRLNGNNFGTTSGAAGQVLNACNFVIPSGPKELKPNLGSDIQLCNPIVANVDARLVGSWYTYTWYKDNVLIPNITTQTYSTNETGRFKVVVSSTGCLPGVDSVDITTNAATAINATFCAPPAATANLAVTGSGEYKWWDAATAGNVVGKGGTFTTPALSATTTYYVEDTSTISGSVGPTVLNTSGLSGYNGSQLGFTLSQDIEITSLRVPFKTNYSPAGGYPGFTITLEIVDQGGNPFSPAQTFTSGASVEPVPGNDGGNTHLYTFPFTNFIISSSLGSNLRLKFVSATQSSVAASFNSGATFSYPYNSSIPGVVTINGSYTNGGAINTSDYAFFYDWQFKTRTNLCLRVPVVATLSCTPPACVKPTSVSVQLGSGINDTLCVGNALLIQKDIIDTSAATLLNEYYFSWKKINSSGSTIIQGPSKTYSDLSITSVALADSGSYYLIVQDGLAADPTCKDSAFVTIKINQSPATKALIASHQEICLGDAANNLTEIVPPVNYAGAPLYHQWYTTTDTTGTPILVKISAASTAITYNPGSPVLTQYYVRKDSVKFCPAVATNFLKIRVNNSVVADTILPLENDTLCVSAHNKFQLKGVFDALGIASSINNGYHFTWMKSKELGITPTVIGTPGPYMDYPPISMDVAEDDSGYYYLIIRDGAGATVCQDTLITKVKVVATCTLLPPTCAKPVLVSATLIGNDTLCVGNGFTIQKNVIDLSAGPPSDGYYYSWRRINDAGSVLLAPPSASYSDLVLSNITQADSGRYYLIVQDGINSGPLCKDSSAVISIVINAPIDAAPIVEASQIICEGSVPDMFTGITGMATYYQWYISTDSFKTVPASQLIPGAISDSYRSSALSATSYFMRRDSVVACPAMNTNILTVQVDKAFVPGVVGNDTLICTGSPIPAFKEISVASGGTGVFKYQWQSSGDSYTYSDIPGETNNTYQSPVLASNTYFRRIDSSGVCSEKTNKISIVVNNPIIGSAVIGASDTICKGSIPNLLEASASGVPDYYQWYISTDSFKTVPATQLIAGATGGTYQPDALSVTSYFIRKDSVVACPAFSSNIITIQVDPPVIPGVMGNDTVVCSGSPILEFKEIVAASGGIGLYTYQWQKSGDNVTFTDISSATNNTYQSPDITIRTYFRRIDSSGVCGSKITDTIFVDAVSGANPGLITGTSPTICYNTVPTVTFTNVAAASGGTGGPGSDTYQWQISTDGIYWTDIIGATGLSYKEPSPLTDTMYYRREVGMGPGTCDTSYTLPIAINVYDPFVVGSIPAETTVCEGTSVTIDELTATSGGGNPNTPPIYKWIESIDKGVTWATATGISNMVHYTSPVLTDSIWYRRAVTVTCNKDTSNIMKVNVDSINTVAVVMTDVSTCAGTNAIFAPVFSGGGTTPLFEWYKLETATGLWQSIGNGGDTYTVINPQAGDNGTFYKVVLSSSFVCNSGDDEDVAELTVNAVTIPIVSIASNPAGPMCDTTTSITYTAAPVQGDAGAATYQWYDAVTNLPILLETGLTYTPATPPSNGDQVYVIMTSDVVCASPLTATSDTITQDVRTMPSPVITNNDTTVCTPVEVILRASGITSGSNNFQWYVNGVLIPNANQINHPATTSDLPAGIDTARYTVIEDNGVCSAESDTVTVVILQSPSADAGTDITAVEGETILLNGSVSSNTTNLVWIPSGGLSDRYILNPSLVVPGITTAYTLVAYNNSNKCSSSDAVTINVIKRIVIPNVITVNGDGANDTWEIANIENFPDAEFLIYNRWGNLVWKSDGYPKQWDGSNYRNGEVLPEGTYFYIIDLHTVKVKDPYTGWVQIIK